MGAEDQGPRGVDATRIWLARRALELGAPLGAADRALAEVTASVADDLAKRAEARSLPAPRLHGPVGDALGRRLRHGRLDALEAGFTRWADRRPGGVVHSAIDEWREFVALRGAYDAAVAAGGVELRRLAFPHAYRTGNSMATWLWNTQGVPDLARDLEVAPRRGACGRRYRSDRARPPQLRARRADTRVTLQVLPA